MDEHEVLLIRLPKPWRDQSAAILRCYLASGSCYLAPYSETDALPPSAKKTSATLLGVSQWPELRESANI